MRGFIQFLVLGLALSFPLGIAAIVYPHLTQPSSTLGSRIERMGMSADTAEAAEAPRKQARAFTEPPLEPSPTATEERFSPLDVAPPPTVTAPEPEAVAAPATATPATSDVLARAEVYNTGGIGAKLRAEPVNGGQVAALRDGQPLEVLERIQTNGDDWLRVRTANGVEGWVVGRVAKIVEELPTAAPQPAANPNDPRAVALSGQANDLPMGGLRSHTVQRGDELRHIAARYGVDMMSIIAINDIPNPDSLRVGQVLQIPDSLTDTRG